jgi:hypothetical protein
MKLVNYDCANEMLAELFLEHRHRILGYFTTKMNELLVLNFPGQATGRSLQTRIDS